ncbi:hypothetical protein RN001_013809 [Aquatica leii]|uniref:Fucosyltransferase n=1 Tax=Aquatica leii TaxID=1421715 RepID=A0AAN7P0L2_9COLE|nr:hypothetical protein RN001_013809 [Aquatica leii]
MIRATRKIEGLKILLAASTILILIHIYTEVKHRIYIDTNVYENSNGKWRNLTQEQIQNLSNLGRMLFLGERPPPSKSWLASYKILWWRFEPDLALRHNRNPSNLLKGCSVQNCKMSFKDNELETADLVVFYLHRTQTIKQIPNRTAKRSQIWAFLTDESPYNTFSYKTDNHIQSYNNIFNWSMNYRMTSDIPVPYGRAIALNKNAAKINIVEWNNSKRQDVLVAIAVSHCTEKRLEYVKELNNYIRVDMYGSCGTLKCSGHYYTDCTNTSAYKFYLAFENSNCEEYITEKVWWYGYHKNSIPIIMGSTKLNMQQILPPKSYIAVNDFASPKDLAKYLLHLNNSLSELESFFEWKRYFNIYNEHGFTSAPSVYYCRMCEALNYNSKQIKIYSNIEDFIGVHLCS